MADGALVDGRLSDIANVQARLQGIIGEMPLTTTKFCVVPSDYYSMTLEERKGLVGADTVDQMCKSMIMENTKLKVFQLNVRLCSEFSEGVQNCRKTWQVDTALFLW